MAKALKVLRRLARSQAGVRKAVVLPSLLAALGMAGASTAYACTIVGTQAHYLSVTPNVAPDDPNNPTPVPLALAGYCLNSGVPLMGTPCTDNGGNKVYALNSGAGCPKSLPQCLVPHFNTAAHAHVDPCNATVIPGSVVVTPRPDPAPVPPGNFVVAGTATLTLPASKSGNADLYYVCSDPDPGYLWNYFTVI